MGDSINIDQVSPVNSPARNPSNLHLVSSGTGDSDPSMQDNSAPSPDQLSPDDL